jgi:hypothetical protein
MTEEYTPEELNEAYFVQLVYTFQAAAMQQMGKLTNPLTGKVEKNMEQAKHSIDMLNMLESKTKGNLTEKENKLLERALFELRMNYVDEMKVTEEKAETPAVESSDEKETTPDDEERETRTADDETAAAADEGAQDQEKEAADHDPKHDSKKRKKKQS